jgi:hypothetical protein
LVFQPRLPNYFIPQVRSLYLNHFLDKTVANSHLSPQDYWQTREFYYPGVFYVYQDGLEPNHIEQFTTTTALRLHTQGTFPILFYDSPKWQSYESLVNTSELADLVDLPDYPILYSDSETKIYRTGDQTIFFFIKSYSELKITNGFIYTKEQILKDYRYWFGVSVVTE